MLSFVVFLHESLISCAFSLVFYSIFMLTLQGDLVYKFKKIMGRTNFSDQFRKMIIRHKRIGFDFNVMRQSACLVSNTITVDNFAALFNCTPVDRASDYMMAPTKSYSF